MIVHLLWTLSHEQSIPAEFEVCERAGPLIVRAFYAPTRKLYTDIDAHVAKVSVKLLMITSRTTYMEGPNTYAHQP